MFKGLKNPVAVFLFSLDHKSGTLNKILRFLRLYEAIRPFPFEHYCVFCAKNVCDDWWRDREYFENDEMWMRLFKRTI